MRVRSSSHRYLIHIWCRDVDAVQTYRIREIKNSPRRAFYGRTLTTLSACSPQLADAHGFTGVDVTTVVFGQFLDGDPFLRITDILILQAISSSGMPTPSSVRYAYLRARSSLKVILDVVDVDMPPWERTSTGLWIDISKSVLDLMKDKGINPAEAIHSAQHAFLNRFPMSSELRTECKAPEKEYKATATKRKRPARFVICVTVH